MRTPIAAALGFAALASIAIYAWWNRSVEKVREIEQMAAPVTVSAPAEAFLPARADQESKLPGIAQAVKTPAVQVQLVDLPAAGVRLRDSFDVLVKASNQGDSRASCRLADEVFICSSEYLATAQVTNSPEKQATALARRAGLCDGFEESRARAAWEYLLLAALQGHAHSKYLFAIAPQMSLASMLATPAYLAAHRTYYRQFLEDALKAGEIGAALHLIDGNLGKSPWKALHAGADGILVENEQLALTYIYVLKQIYPQFAAAYQKTELEASGRLTAEQVSAASLQATTIASQLPPDQNTYALLRAKRSGHQTSEIRCAYK